MIVGDNDAKQETINYIFGKFLEFRDAIFPTRVVFVGHMRLKDLLQELISKNNMYLRNKLGYQIKSTKIIRREDFSDKKMFHFDKNGKGYRHMAVLIVSVLQEFCSSD